MKKTALASGLALTIWALSIPASMAQPRPAPTKDLFTITVDTKGYQPYRIAVPAPLANDRGLAQFVRKVMVNNLRIATAFKVLSPRTYPKRWRAPGVTPKTRSWRAIGSQGLILAQARE